VEQNKPKLIRCRYLLDMRTENVSSRALLESSGLRLIFSRRFANGCKGLGSDTRVLARACSTPRPLTHGPVREPDYPTARRSNQSIWHGREAEEIRCRQPFKIRQLNGLKDTQNDGRSENSKAGF
jgi:hypothetical protein